MSEIKHLADMSNHQGCVLSASRGLLGWLQGQVQFSAVPDLDGPSRVVHCARGTFTIYNTSIHRRTRSLLTALRNRDWSQWDTLLTPSNYYSIWLNGKLFAPAVQDNPWQVENLWTASQLEDLLEEIRDPRPQYQVPAITITTASAAFVRTALQF